MTTDRATATPPAGTETPAWADAPAATDTPAPMDTAAPTAIPPQAVGDVSHVDAAADSCRWLAIVVPTLQEGAAIAATLAALQPLRARGARVVVVDGGSRDDTVARARGNADTVIVAGRGRAQQMNAGARQVGTEAEVLLFLHADTQLPPQAAAAIAAARARGARWGRFDVRIEARSRLLDGVAFCMNWRSRLTGICTGDQAIFVERALFEALGGWPEQPLMEDIEFSRRARRRARPAALTAAATTSGRRWERRGIVRTIVQMWTLRWRYWRGADPAVLAREYREVR